VAPGVITTITGRNANGVAFRPRALASSMAMIVRARLFCSDPRCTAAFEAIGPIEELETLACSCGGGLELVGFPDVAERPARGRFVLLPLAP
jgi:hypothetical protein